MVVSRRKDAWVWGIVGEGRREGAEKRKKGVGSEKQSVLLCSDR